jgi:hypothetical protein
MRFMMLMIPAGYESAPREALPPKEGVEAMLQYNEAMRKAGVLLAADGLHPPAEGARLRRAGGKLTVTDGPFAEAKEAIGGYWLIQVKSKAEAIEWASRCPAVQSYAPDGVATIELRQLQELGDWPAEFQVLLGKYPELQKLGARA